METYQGENELPYDLRQIYAVNLVGEHLQDVARARKEDDFKAYFKCLKDLWIITQHKIKAKAKDAPEQYQKLLDEVIDKINLYPMVFAKKSNNAKGSWEIENTLNELEMFLYDKIEEAKMFGAKPEPENF